MTSTKPLAPEILGRTTVSEQARSSLTDQIVDAFLEKVASDDEIPRIISEQLRVAFAASSLRQSDVNTAFEATVNEELS